MYSHPGFVALTAAPGFPDLIQSNGREGWAVQEEP